MKWWIKHKAKRIMWSYWTKRVRAIDRGLREGVQSDKDLVD